MASLRRIAWMCRKLTKQHVDDPDVPAAPDGADGYAEWVQITLNLYRDELEKSLRETEHYLNEMPGVHFRGEHIRSYPLGGILPCIHRLCVAGWVYITTQSDAEDSTG